jgi:hypothetical protein
MTQEVFTYLSPDMIMFDNFEKKLKKLICILSLLQPDTLHRMA